MSIEICTHCYAKNLPQYAVFLRAQLSSLLLHPPKVKHSITVCWCADDQNTGGVIRDFLNTKLNLIHLVFEPGKLFRRAIGRNTVGLLTLSDLVWYSDCDHFFGMGCIDQLWEIWNTLDDPKPVMVFPKSILVQADYKTADDLWVDNLSTKGLIDINPSDFVPKINYKAIGGIQIVDGAFARQYGYLNDQKKWQQPVDPTRPFKDFRDDVKFRNFCYSKGEVEAIDLKGLYRLRHTKVTYKG